MNVLVYKSAMTFFSGGPNLHSVWMRAGLLAVRCKQCTHGHILDDTRLPIHQGNMTPLASLKLVCNTCGSREFEISNARSMEEARQFIDPIARSG